MTVLEQVEQAINVFDNRQCMEQPNRIWRSDSTGKNPKISPDLIFISYLS